jgi:hypothetical protein
MIQKTNYKWNAWEQIASKGGCFQYPKIRIGTSISNYSFYDNKGQQGRASVSETLHNYGDTTNGNTEFGAIFKTKILGHGAKSACY